MEIGREEKKKVKGSIKSVINNFMLGPFKIL